MRVGTVVRIVSILAFAIGAASGHHPFSVTYDAAKAGTLVGKVAKVQWANPHVVLALDVPADAGKTERWLIEGYPPNTLGRQGWKNDALREGAQITVSGWHAHDDMLKVFHGREVTFEDGSKCVFGSNPNDGDSWRCGSGDCAEWLPSIAQ